MRETEAKKEITYPYRGIQGIEISSSGFLFDEKGLYEMVRELNKNRPKKDLIKIELNPNLHLINNPKLISLYEDGQRLTKTIHFPNSYDLRDFKEPFRVYNLKQKISAQAFRIIFGYAQDKRFSKLAKDRELEINLHPNVAEAFKKSGELENLKNNAPAIYVENTTPFPSYWIEDKRILFDPNLLKKYILENHLSGLTLDTDHLKKIWYKKIKDYENGFNLIPTIHNNRDVISRIHLSGDKKEHGFLTSDDPFFINFLDKVSQISSHRPLVIVFEENPFEVLKLTSSQKLKIYSSKIELVDFYRRKNENYS